MNRKGTEIGNINLKEKLATDFTEEREDDYAELRKERAERQKAQEEERIARLEAEREAEKETEKAAEEIEAADVQPEPAAEEAKPEPEQEAFTLPQFEAKKPEKQAEEPAKKEAEDLFDEEGTTPIELGYDVADDEGNPIFYAPAGKKFEKLGSKEEVADRLAAAAEEAPKVTVIDGGKKEEEESSETELKEEAVQKTEGAKASGLDELLSERHRKIKAARYDRVFIDGKRAEGRKLFDTEKEMSDFVGGLSGKGAVRKGYYKGYRVNGVLPPVAVTGTTADFVRCQGDQMDEDDLVGYGVISKDAFSFLKAAVAGGCSLLVAGDKKTGKTSLLDRLAKYAGGEDDLFYAIENRLNELCIEGRDVLKELAMPEEGVTEEYLLKEAADEASVIALGAVTEDSADGYLAALRKGVQCLATIETDKDATSIAKSIASVARENAAEVGDALSQYGDLLVTMFDDAEDDIKKVGKICWLRKDKKANNGLFVENLFARKGKDLAPAGGYPDELAEKCKDRSVKIDERWFGR